MQPDRVPDVTFHTRVRNDALEGPNPYEWRDLSSQDVFDAQHVVVVGLPGAFTPACSDSHLPAYERHYEDFRRLGIDRIVCVAVNDAFVMFQWARSLGVEKVFMLPDGNGHFTRRLGMLVDRSAQGMGMRSWRYSMLVEDGVIRKVFAEPGIRDNPKGVGVSVSGAQTLLEYLQSEAGAAHPGSSATAPDAGSSRV